MTVIDWAAGVTAWLCLVSLPLALLFGQLLKAAAAHLERKD